MIRKSINLEWTKKENKSWPFHIKSLGIWYNTGSYSLGVTDFFRIISPFLSIIQVIMIKVEQATDYHSIHLLINCKWTSQRNNIRDNSRSTWSRELTEFSLFYYFHDNLIFYSHSIQNFFSLSLLPCKSSFLFQCFFVHRIKFHDDDDWLRDNHYDKIYRNENEWMFSCMFIPDETEQKKWIKICKIG